MGSTVKRFLQERQAILTSAAAFVGFLVAATVLMAQEGKHHGSGCEWDPETFEVVCEPTATATATTKPVDHAATAAAQAEQTREAVAALTAEAIAAQTAEAIAALTAEAIAAQTAEAVAALTAEAIAAQTAEAVAALTAEAIAEQTREAIATQTAAAQATLTAIAQQTTVIVDPNRPQTVTAIARLTQTAAAALTATAVAETWTATPTPTHTPTPTATATSGGGVDARGWISSSATTLSVGGSALVTAGWSPASLDVMWDISNLRVLWRSDRCSGTTPRFPEVPEPDEASLTVYACEAGTSVVSMKVRGGKTLASVTITVEGNGGGDDEDDDDDDEDTGGGGTGGGGSTPTGWVRATPSTILVDESTRLTAGWSKPGLNTEITISNPTNSTVLARSQACSDTSQRSVTPEETSLTLWGCAVGEATVRLFAVSPRKQLASVKVRVLKAPELKTKYARRGWRWFDIDWTAVGLLEDFRVEYHAKKGSPSDFVRLPAGGNSGSRGIANVMTTTAQVRGLRHINNRILVVRVVGITDDGFEVPSNSIEVMQGAKPLASGHLPDHTMQYTLDMLGTTGLDGWMRRQAHSSASVWANHMATLVSCRVAAGPPRVTCPNNRNTDMETVTLKTGSGCRTNQVACITNNSAQTLTFKLDDDRELIFPLNPRMGTTHFVWSSTEGDHADDAGQNMVYVWVGAGLTHEFGHAFGLRDWGIGERIMNGGWMLGDEDGTRPTSVDFADLTDIYVSHTRNHGW